MDHIAEEGRMFTHRSPTTLELVALAIAMLGGIAALIVSIGGLRTIYYFLRGDTHADQSDPLAPSGDSENTHLVEETDHDDRPR